ncbi:hypothetical protein B0A49_00395 [Cryomyces minteri]|uniref:ABM domain-containing protein n=1 Tax=Cryomyces minteri TaxID=331657 RepID=A0A4U0XTS9_9PEZI|nr:hypothetical protein B0A49_00395 [Cryomyces minteri]
MFIIFGNLNFVPGKYDEWQAAYRELEKYVVDNERESTLSYYFGVPEEYGRDMSNSTQMIAFEAYNVREDLYETHFHSKAMDKFLATIPTLMTTGLDLTHYENTSGFLDKPGDRKECGIIYDTRITAKEGKRDEVLGSLAKLAQWAEKNEDDTYTFLVLKSLDNDTQVRVFERYATRKALEAHQSAKEVLDFFMGSKDIIASVEGRGYTPNGAGWLHR